jgi:hypothetical protein
MSHDEPGTPDLRYEPRASVLKVPVFALVHAFGSEFDFLGACKPMAEPLILGPVRKTFWRQRACGIQQ